MEVGPGFCPDYLRAATSRTRCLPRRQATGTKLRFPPRRKAPTVPALSSPHKGHSPLWGPHLCLGKPLIPPFLKSSALDYNGTVALLTFVFTAEAQLVVGDSAGLRQKESKFLLSLIAHSGHRVPPFRYSCFSGRFSLHFRPVCRFQRRGGILTLPQRRKGHTGATAGFAVFSQCGWYLFCKCIFSYKQRKA